MKKTLVIAAAMMMAMPAYASKARLTALGNSAHLVDVQAAFEKPHQFNEVGELVTFEWGGNNVTPGTGSHADGGFVRKHNESVWGLYLGRQSQDFSDGVADANTIVGVPNTFIAEENALNLIYGGKAGALTWGTTFKYSNADLKTTDQKSNSMGIAFGITDGVWDAALVAGLAGSSENGAVGEIKNKGNYKVHGGWKMDTMYFHGAFKMTASEVTPNGAPAVAEFDNQYITIGAVNSTKVEGADFFYGVSYNTSTEKEKVGNTKTDSSSLPVVIGVEAEAASWLTLRASLSQNVILGETKTAAGKDTVRDNTVVAAGAGLKFGKLTLDGTLATGDGQFLDNHGTDGLLANGSLTYTF